MPAGRETQTLGGLPKKSLTACGQCSTTLQFSRCQAGIDVFRPGLLTLAGVMYPASDLCAILRLRVCKKQLCRRQGAEPDL